MPEKRDLHLNEKIKNVSVRITTRASGSTKNYFIQDCINRDISESKVNNNILKIYYDVTNSSPIFKGKEFSEIKKILLDKLK